MPTRKARTSLSKKIARRLGVAGTTSLVCAAGLAGWTYWFGYLRVDVGEVQGWPNAHLWMAAFRFEDWAKDHEGLFPEQGENAQRLLVPQPHRVLDPWNRPFQYEVLPPNGTEARVYTLGRDNRPGGDGLDSDIVWWIAPEGVGRTDDLRVRPSSWSQRDQAESR